MGWRRAFQAEKTACAKVLWLEREQWEVTEVLRKGQMEGRVGWKRNLIRLVLFTIPHLLKYEKGLEIARGGADKAMGSDLEELLVA